MNTVNGRNSFFGVSVMTGAGISKPWNRFLPLVFNSLLLNRPFPLKNDLPLRLQGMPKSTCDGVSDPDPLGKKQGARCYGLPNLGRMGYKQTGFSGIIYAKVSQCEYDLRYRGAVVSL
jgi:hypothetical protein